MKKRIVALALVVCILLTNGCSPIQEKNEGKPSVTTEITAEVKPIINDQDIPQFDYLDDPNLCPYLEKQVYSEVVSSLNSEEYFVEDVKAIYISKEYLEELAYNSQSNIYFGYTLSEIEDTFGEEKYIFTCDGTGKTIVSKYELYDDTFNRVIKNVAIGSGVILLCVTVSLVSGGLGAPAISAIFAVSAKTGTIVALESAAIGGVMTAAVTGYVTKSVEETLKQTALSASEGFKVGALTGAVIGGGGKFLTLKQATKGGLTLKEAAIIQKERGLSSRFIGQISSMEEYRELVQIEKQGGLAIESMAKVCEKTNYPLEVVKFFKKAEEGTIYSEQAGLVAKNVNGNIALVREIDLGFKSELPGETVTNLERMKRGYAAIDPITGETYQLHHIGQSVNSPLAILTQAEHASGSNSAVLHNVNITEGQGVHSLITKTEWASQRKKFWMGMYEILK